MHVTLRQLRVFDAVVRHLSFTRAAAEMHLTQPAVSMLVSQLEEAVGLPLFDKLGRQLYLTEAGQEVHRLSRNLAAQFRETEGALLALKGLGSGRLDIAVASTVNYFAPKLLGVFHRRYPGITLKLEVTNREHLVHLLDHNQVDLVLMGQPPEDLNLASEPFMSNPLVVIAPPRASAGTGASHPTRTSRSGNFCDARGRFRYPPGHGTLLCRSRHPPQNQYGDDPQRSPQAGRASRNGADRGIVAYD
ncbi:hypothetical protein CCP4SC76_5800014 [Gammaproteobacteria bacterium]